MSGPPHPLRDNSGGLLKGWPGGTFYPPRQPPIDMFRPAYPDEKPVATVERHDGDELVSCKYCYRDEVQPLWLYEELPLKDGGVLRSRMMICSLCGSGLEPSETLQDGQQQ